MKNCIVGLNPWAAELVSCASTQKQVSVFRTANNEDHPLFEYAVRMKSSVEKRPYLHRFREILQIRSWNEEGEESIEEGIFVFIKLEKRVGRSNEWKLVPESVWVWEQPQQSILERARSDPWVKRSRHASTAFFSSGVSNGFLWNTGFPHFLNM